MPKLFQILSSLKPEKKKEVKSDQIVLISLMWRKEIADDSLTLTLTIIYLNVNCNSL